MEIETKKGRNPELLTDWNGHAVQCFPLGGETVLVAAASSFITKSALIRVTNTSLADTGFIRRGLLGGDDPGAPIPVATSEVFAVYPGEMYEVIGSGLYITFIRDRSV